MGRIRTIKPEFWSHEELSALPEATHMLAGALLNYADDEGYFNANIGLVKAACSPLREPSVSIQESLTRLAATGYLQLGVAADGKRYGRVVTFDTHQRVNRPTPSKIKALQIVWEDSPNPHTQLSEPSLPEGNREGKGTGNREQGVSGELRSPSGNDVPDLAGSKPAKRSRKSKAAGEGGEAESHDNRVVDVVLDCYHRILPNCRRAETLTGKRRKAILTANNLAKSLLKRVGWEDMTVRQFWTAYFEECSREPWLRGEVPNPNNPSWKQNIETLVDEKRFSQIMDQAIERQRKAGEDEGDGMREAA